LAHFLGASSLAQKYCPPAFGIALASSLRVIPTQVDINASRGMPYMMSRGPPESIPVTNAAEIPHQEFVRAKPTPRTDQTLKLRRMSCL
jgi:hypothetical protein